VEIVQFFDTDAETARLAVAVAAIADPHARDRVAATSNFNIFVLFILILPSFFVGIKCNEPRDLILLRQISVMCDHSRRMHAHRLCPSTHRKGCVQAAQPGRAGAVQRVSAAAGHEA
jgi:hypothetical protein